MLPEISTIESINPAHSVIYITQAGFFPGDISLSSAEMEYARNRFGERDDIIHINSFIKSTFIVSLKSDLPYWRMLEELRMAACRVLDISKALNLKELAISPVSVSNAFIEAFAEGLLLSMYSFTGYKTTEEGRSLFTPRLLLHSHTTDEYQTEWLRVLTEAVWHTRNLINEPVMAMNTRALERAVTAMGEHNGFRTEVLGRSRIESLKMGGLLAVNRGSIDPPAFIITEWKPTGHLNSKPVVLVGKGVVFDTGGMSLKTGSYMEGMKTDMAGAAAVAGVMYALSGSKIPLHVIGLMPVTDNRVGGNALVPGDVVTMHNGKTVEVLNTDAEGRLILADALSYSGLYDPILVISIATLTGAAAVTFSNQATAMLGNASEEMFDLLDESGLEVYERVARLPFWHEYGDAMKSDIADLKNIDNREADTIKAGKFLEKFVSAPFIHLDIAGPGYLKKDDHYRKKEGPGTGVRLLATFCKKLVSHLENIKT